MILTADTNVLIYAQDPAAEIKESLAAQVMTALAAGRHPIGLQAIGEFQSALRRRLKVPLWKAAGLGRDLLTTYPHFPHTASAVADALDDMEAGRLSYWDALLVRSAAEHGCTAMFSEDMQDGSRLAGVEIVNPFGATGLSDRARELLTL